MLSFSNFHLSICYSFLFALSSLLFYSFYWVLSGSCLMKIHPSVRRSIQPSAYPAVRLSVLPRGTAASIIATSFTLSLSTYTAIFFQPLPTCPPPYRSILLPITTAVLLPTTICLLFATACERTGLAAVIVVIISTFWLFLVAVALHSDKAIYSQAYCNIWPCSLPFHRFLRIPLMSFPSFFFQIST